MEKKILAQTLFVDGREFVIPGGMTDKEVTTLCAMLLRFRRVDEFFPSDYNQRFSYQDLDYVPVRLGLRELYVTEAEARAARDARNVEIEATKAAEAEASARAIRDSRERADDLHFSQ